MRINRQILLGIARDIALQEGRARHDLLSVYLIGSILEPEPLIGGTTDIDLVFVWNSPPKVARELRPLSEQVHLDIAHHDRDVYHSPRNLRMHPWLGTDIAGAQILYDPYHFMEFAQASVRGLFDRAEYRLARARGLLDKSQQICRKLASGSADITPWNIEAYLSGLENAANALVLLDGAPLTERRFLTRLAGRLDESLEKSLYPDWLSLFGAADLSPEIIRGWLPDWGKAFEGYSGPEVSVASIRRGYYQQAIETCLLEGQTSAAAWILIRGWTRLAAGLETQEKTWQAWQAACRALGLVAERLPERVAALDVYLDRVDEALEGWGRRNGVW
jgi:hypothetical protein